VPVTGGHDGDGHGKNAGHGRFFGWDTGTCGV
jgi:hypothetical protein